MVSINKIYVSPDTSLLFKKYNMKNATSYDCKIEDDICKFPDKLKESIRRNMRSCLSPLNADLDENNLPTNAKINISKVYNRLLFAIQDAGYTLRNTEFPKFGTTDKITKGKKCIIKIKNLPDIVFEIHNFIDNGAEYCSLRIYDDIADKSKRSYIGWFGQVFENSFYSLKTHLHINNKYASDYIEL